jgi:purine-binding chemotaxis protein CheW
MAQSSSGSGGSKEEILEARARKLAQAVEGRDEGALYDTVVVVTVGDEKLGIPAESLRIISERFSVTPVFGAPPWLAGITHVRGELLSVVHLAYWLGHSGARAGSRLAVVESARGSLGLLVDDVMGFREILESELSTTLSPNATAQRFTRAITQDLVTILDVRQLLLSDEIVVDQSVKRVALSERRVDGG